MKIAIASEGKTKIDSVSDRAGRAPFYLIFEDSELIDKCICSPYDYKGFAVIYAPGKDEYGLCNSSEFLEYKSSIRCIESKENWVDITLEEYAEDVGLAASELLEIEI